MCISGTLLVKRQRPFSGCKNTLDNMVAPNLGDWFYETGMSFSVFLFHTDGSCNISYSRHILPRSLF